METTSQTLSIYTLIPALKAISSIEKSNLPRTWIIKLNKDRFRSIKINQESIINLFKAIDVKIIEEEREKIVLEIPNDNSLENYIEEKRELLISSFKPRNLTNEEIENIVKNLPKVLSPVEDISEKARSQIIERLKDQLSEIKITPLGIPDLIEAINYRFERARLEPGEAIGLTISEALSSLTQAALNAFHQTGSRFNINTGIEMLQDLLAARIERKHENCNIHFLDKNMDFEQIFRKQVDFVAITVGDLILDYIIDSPKNFDDYWWVSMYPNLTGKNLPTTSTVIRLEMSKIQMYSNQITMEDVANAIESYNLPEIIKVIVGPFDTGLIFVYPEENIVSGPLKKLKIPTSDDVSKTFLEEIFLPQLSKIKIKGISGIKSLNPTSVTTWSIVENELKLSSVEDLGELNTKEEIDRSERLWLLQLSRYIMGREGITPEKLSKLLTLLGFEILEITDVYIIVISPNYEKPSKYVLSEISKSEDVINKRRKNKNYKNQQDINNEIYKASRYFYAVSDGDNLIDIFSRTDVDTRITSSNNPQSILRILGIEAARNLLIQEFLFILENASLELDPRHIILLSDFMTNRGVILPISFWGMIRQNPGPLTVASFGKAINVFKTAAAFGESEQIRTISSGMYVGQKGKFGTGYVDLRIDEEMIKKFDESISGKQEISSQDIENAIDQIDKVSFGAENEIQADPFAELASLSLPPKLPETKIGNGIISAPLEIAKSTPIISTLAEKAIEKLQPVVEEPPKEQVKRPTLRISKLSTLRKTNISSEAPKSIPKAKIDSMEQN